jgi:hypothetical protein
MQNQMVSEYLKNGKVISSELAEWGVTGATFVTIKDFGRAVTKYKYEAPEVAAYLINCIGGFDFVPVTVFRKFKSITSANRYNWPKRHSFQHFIEDSVIWDDSCYNHMLVPPDEIKAQRAKMVLFDYIIANADRNNGNYLVDGDKKLWAIDHGFTFFNNPDYSVEAALYSIEKFPELRVNFQNCLDNKFRLAASLCRIIPKKKISEMLKRLDDLDKILPAEK